MCIFQADGMGRGAGGGGKGQERTSAAWWAQEGLRLWWVGACRGRAEAGWVEARGGAGEETRPAWVLFFSFYQRCLPKSDKSRNLEGLLVESSGPQSSPSPEAALIVLKSCRYLCFWIGQCEDWLRRQRRRVRSFTRRKVKQQRPSRPRPSVLVSVCPGVRSAVCEPPIAGAGAGGGVI